MTLEIKNFLEKQKKLIKCFQTKVRFEIKLVVYEAGDVEDKFIEEAILYYRIYSVGEAQKNATRIILKKNIKGW